MADQGDFERQSSGLICQNCGVTVAPGYPKCPKCHNPMPAVASPLARHGTQSAGGTSAASDSGGLGIWIGLLVLALVAGGVIFFVVRKGHSKGAADGQAAVASGRDAGGEEETEPPAQEAVVEPALDDGDAGEPITPDEALDGLEQSLAERRLYSGVEQNAEDDTAVRIESAQCEDPGMREAVDAAREALLSAGFSHVDCYSLHGTRLFETDL